VDRASEDRSTDETGAAAAAAIAAAADDQPVPPPKKAEAKRNFTRDLLSVMVSRFLTKGCQFLIGVVVARLVGPEGRGLIASLNVAPDLAITFSQLGVRQSVAYYVGRKVHDLAEIVPTLVGLSILSNMTALSACLAYYYFSGLLFQPWILVVLALAPIPFMSLTNYASGVFLGKQMIVRFNRVNWVPMALNLIFLMIIGWAWDAGVSGVLIAALIADIASCAYALYLLHSVSSIRLGFRLEIARKLTRLGIVYALALFLLTLNYRLPILLLQNLSSFSEVGIYSVGQALALSLWEIPGMLSSLVFSRGVNAKDSDAFGDKVVVLCRLVVFAGTIVAIGCAVAGPYIIPLVYGADFTRSATILTMLLPGTVAFMAFKILHMDVAGRGWPWVSMPVVIPCMLANLGIGYLVVPIYGAVGAAALTSASYALATLVYIVIYARITRRSLGSMLLYRRSDFTTLLTRLRAIRK
jgi:O-antigen/teichoic acid export membrane protein